MKTIEFKNIIIHHRIIVITPEKLIRMEPKIWDQIVYSDVIFNTNQACILSVEYSFEMMATKVVVCHLELPEVQFACHAPEHYIEDARRIFPYLFTDTNPLLYRRF